MYIMKLNKNDINYLTKSFPNIKLSYVKNIHKKVSSAKPANLSAKAFSRPPIAIPLAFAKSIKF